MASNVILNGVTYDGTPVTNPTHPYKPIGIDVADSKIGVSLVAASGKRRFVQRGIKKTFTLSWKLTNETTRSAVRTLAELSTTFSFTDQFGIVRTCQTEADDYRESYAMTDPAGNLYYDVTLTVRES